MRIFPLLFLMTVIGSAAEAPPPVPTPATTPRAVEAPAPTPPATRKTVEHNGQTFELVNSLKEERVETDEYVIVGEKLGEWTQLLTVQRLTVEKPATAEEFAAYFQKKVQQEGGASLQVIHQARAAAVFAARFPKSDSNEEQIIECLAFCDPKKPNVISLIQYAVKPHRIAQDVVELQLKSWQAKFVQQATALAQQ
jgi:hypothetical protein